MSNFRAGNAFTLVETMVALVLMVMILGGLFYSYTQADNIAEWTSMSLAAQSYASQGLERARSAQWDTQVETNGDQLPATNSSSPVLPPQLGTLDVPQTGAPISVTNYIYETTNQASPPLREIKSVVVWTFPRTGKLYTNVLVTLRAPDQ
ncbi:MAG TPA: type II secretion system protein [Verrucomicrobiae bacterium]|nr:type II secretion system protein [Verrucomicrobiae bacterium]